MSFILNRDINNKAVKKNVSITNTINTNSLKASIGTTGNTQFVTLNTLNLNNTELIASANELNYLQVLPGIAEASKAVVLNSSRNIATINTITCTTSIIVNGNQITSNNDIGGGSSDDINNPYLTNIIPGTGKELKTLITDSKSNISNINNLTTNSLKLLDTELEFNNLNKTYHLDNIKKVVTSKNTTNELLLSRFVSLSNTDTNVNNNIWRSICWSPQLGIFAAVSNSSGNKVAISNNGIQWTSYLTPQFSTIIHDNYHGICWSPELGMFIAVGQSIIRSSDGINWTNCIIPYYINLRSVCWSPELSLFVAVGISGGNNNRVLKSADGIAWTAAEASYNNSWISVCWSSKLKLFVAVASSGENIYRVMTSNNGNNWNLVTHNLFNNVEWYNIIWSEELGLFLATNASANKIVRSSDGINWNYCYPSESTSQWSVNMKIIIWIKELNMAVGFMEENNGYYYSYDGIKWERGNSGITMPFTSIVWSPALGMLVLSTSGSTKLYISRIIKTNKSGFKANSDLIYVDQNTNYVGFNTQNPNKPLEINHSNGNCFKMTTPVTSPASTNIMTFDVASNGILNLTCSNSVSGARSINILTNNSSYGLKLNNVLLLPTITEYSYTSGITNGVGQANKILVVDENNDISNIESLSCSSLTVNGINIDNSNNNNYILNTVPGIAIESKGLITDSLNNITNINRIETLSSELTYNKLFVSNNEENIDTNHLIKKSNNYRQINQLNSVIASSWSTVSISGVTDIVDICWSPELHLFVLITNNTIRTSYDGITWTTQNTGYSLTVNFKSICWSSDLGMFAISSGIASTWNGILTSKDGISWVNREIETNAIDSQVIWVSELKMFVFLSKTAPRGYFIYISRDGSSWRNVSFSGFETTQWSSICWCNKLSLLIACSSNSSKIATSPDGLNWTISTVNDPSAKSYNFIAWSEELNMCIAINGLDLAYSYNGSTWYRSLLPNSAQTIKWYSDLNMFITSGNSTNFSYSYDGLTWNSGLLPNLANWSKLHWVSELNTLLIVKSDQLAYTLVSGLTDNKANLFAHKSQVFMNKSNGRLGIGSESPNYQLELSTDSAGKPSSTTWTVASDSRLKENIELANLNVCYDIIKNLKLKKYKWKNDIFDQHQIYDRTKLGWIADEVEEVFPKAVEIKKAYNLDNCKVLNIDQIVTSIYGFTQKIITDYENIDDDISNMTTKINKINSFISKLELN
jgi:hypothetical protein